MNIKWYGHAAFRLKSRDKFSIITDPYTPELMGYNPITETADIVITSSGDDQAHCRSDLVPGNPTDVNAITIATQPGGTQTIKGITISAIEALEWVHHPEHSPGQNAMYRFTLDGISITHMGDVGNPLTQQQLDFIKGTDILLALAGGYLTLSLDDLKTAIDHANPKLIIPMHFRTLSYKPRSTHWIQSFLSYFDDKDIDFACDYQVSLEQPDLPDKTRVLVLDYVK